jgi:hypothetical protein
MAMSFPRRAVPLGSFFPDAQRPTMEVRAMEVRSGVVVGAVVIPSVTRHAASQGGFELETRSDAQSKK